MIHAEMMQRMSAEELLYWIAYRAIENEPRAQREQTPEEVLNVLDNL